MLCDSPRRSSLLLKKSFNRWVLCYNRQLVAVMRALLENNGLVASLEKCLILRGTLLTLEWLKVFNLVLFGFVGKVFEQLF